ncbi:hypothetical protein K474DRAFT_1659231 [Panus rudis PR-1116 ss-1]|nr:hypothetical protein K474DRAFT_1659231 [Panus rudis PR-1116 ss-1]
MSVNLSRQTPAGMKSESQRETFASARHGTMEHGCPEVRPRGVLEDRGEIYHISIGWYGRNGLGG